jgi:phage terminase small subunit
MAKLKPKQQRFVSEYLLDLNATQAAIRAGYSKKTARQMGQENLSKPVIAAAIAEATKAKTADLDLSADKVLTALGNLAFFDVRKLFNHDGSLKQIHELGDIEAQAIAGFEFAEMFEGKGEERTSVGLLKKLRLADRGQNLERLGKYFKLFVDRVEHSGDPGKQFRDAIDAIIRDAGEDD